MVLVSLALLAYVRVVSLATLKDSNIPMAAIGSKADMGIRQNRNFDSLLTINSRHCVESNPARRSKPFAGSFGGLPDGLVWIVSTDDVEESFTLAGLARLLPSADGSKTRIVI